MVVYLMNTKLDNIPPLGKFLDPFHGYLALVGSDELPQNKLDINGLTNAVEVVWDEHRIPHIFAQNDKDLYFVQGYIMAMDRLWQMEFQTHAAGGRMSEIVGEKAIKYDKFQRRIGMRSSAQAQLELTMQDTEIAMMATTFSDGVNAYIKSLNSDNYPIEYKILNYSPEEWTPLKTCLLLKSMAFTLTGRSTDLVYTRMLNNFGLDVVEELFPVFPSFYDPIIPKGTPFDFTPISLNKHDSLYIAQADREKIPYQPDERNGSNNWAVSGSRTKSGAPILANDPHLGLTLPSIWYAMHLVTPTQNTIGVTIPGAPGIISGFNHHISWGETNGNDDVMDWYDIVFKDASKSEYWYDNQWQKTTFIIEEIKIRDEDSILDTVIYTHHGPVVWEEVDQTLAMGKFSLKNNVRQVSVGRALRWLAHTPANEMRTFYELNRAKNYEDFTKALRHFTCPGQNFVYADREGNVAIWHTGNNPTKWEKQGMFISDGSDPRYDWQGTIPHNQKPHIKNPERGFVSSANQHPTDETYPYFLAEFFWPSFRGHRINERLSDIQDANIFEVLSVQMDNTNIMARWVTPHLISAINNIELNESKSQVLDNIKSWDYSFDHTSIGGTIFQHWFDNLETMVWSDDFGLDDEQYIWPYSNKLAELIQHEPQSKWFDIKTTEEVETFVDVAQSTFAQTVEELVNEFGEINESWQWQNARGTDIRHLAKIPGLGEIGVPTAGGSLVPNATGKYFGPSWRYAVEMTDTPKAYGIYPGGQSGYPGSKYYDNMVDDWSIGKSYPLKFATNPTEINGHHVQFGGAQ